MKKVILLIMLASIASANTKMCMFYLKQSNKYMDKSTNYLNQGRKTQAKMYLGFLVDNEIDAKYACKGVAGVTVDFDKSIKRNTETIKYLTKHGY